MIRTIQVIRPIPIATVSHSDLVPRKTITVSLCAPKPKQPAVVTVSLRAPNPNQIPTCKHAQCKALMDHNCELKGVSLFVRDNDSFINGVVGLGKKFNQIVPCGGKHESCDKCWIATARRELAEEFKIDLSEDVFETRIDCVATIDKSVVILINVHGLCDFAMCKLLVEASYKIARTEFGLTTDEECKTLTKSPNETPEMSAIAANGEMKTLINVNPKYICSSDCMYLAPYCRQQMYAIWCFHNAMYNHNNRNVLIWKK